MPGAVAETSSPPTPLESAPVRARPWRRWLARILFLLLALWVVAEGVSLAIQHTRLRNILTAQIASAMGRPVEVGSYAFSFWGGPVVEARSVIVNEDPRFGAEYFLRADSMALRLTWRSLLHGRLEFATLSVTRPSLNLVRNADGDWNLAEWLPRPGAGPASHVYPGPVLPPMTTRFRRMEIEGGRINFKIEDEKLPFAFVGVTGLVETDRPGRWRINLQATPWRAAVVVQQAGMLHVSGDIGGTSSRMRPAALNINWTDASLSDVLRLARGDDFAVRGSLALSVDARTDDASAEGWTAKARAELSQLHRWDLAQRPDNPSLNLIAQIAWSPSAPVVNLIHARMETPRSTLDANGGFYWASDPGRVKRTVRPPQAIYSSAQIDAGDLMAWFRAFHGGIADNLSARGVAQVSAALAGWPPRIVNASVSSEGIDFTRSAPREFTHLGRLEFRYRNGLVSVIPVNLTWGPPGAPAGSLRLEVATKKSANAIPFWHVSGNASQVRDVIAGASALGWNISRGWDVAGPLTCDLHWQSVLDAGFVSPMLHPLGWIEFGAPGTPSDGAALRAPFLNLPIEHINARIDLKPGLRQIKVLSAEAFGAHWTGTFERRDSPAPWQFNLSADRLSSTALDRWLDPRWRESFLDRMLLFLNSRSAASAAPEILRAKGSVAVDRVTLAPLVVSRLQGILEVAGRRISLRDAAGQFYGGQLTGSLDVNLLAVPSYRADLDFSRVDTAALLADLPNVHGVSAEAASARILLNARGVVRSDLVDSLSCQGSARLTDPKLEKVHASGESAASGVRALHYSAASAEFSCGQRKIEFKSLALQAPEGAFRGSGTVDFAGALDLRFEPASAEQERQSVAALPFHLIGTLAAPQLATISSNSGRRSR